MLPLYYVLMKEFKSGLRLTRFQFNFLNCIRYILENISMSAIASFVSDVKK